MCARAKAREFWSELVQSQGTAQVTLGAAVDAPGRAFLRSTTRSAFSSADTRSTRRHPVPPHNLQSLCAMEDSIGAKRRLAQQSTALEISAVVKNGGS